MKRQLILALLLALTSVTSPAQSLDDAQRKAAIMIDRFAEKFKKMALPRIDFEYTIESRQDDLKETMTGTLYLKPRQKKMRVEMPDQIIVADGKYIWVIQKDLKEITKDVYGPEFNQMNPFDLLSEYREKFLYAYMGPDRGPDGKKWELVELTPLDKSVDYFKIKLFFAPKGNRLRFFRIYDKAGVIYTFNIKTLKNIHAKGKNFFSVRPDEYADYHLTDMTK